MKEERESEIRSSIFESTHALLQTLSTSFGPKGLDKMFIKNNKTTVTNDGATILKFFTEHPIHTILSNVSSSQDEKCGDGTTSVVILACSLLNAVKTLINSNIHPSVICDNLEKVKHIAINYIDKHKIPIFVNEEGKSLVDKFTQNTNLFNTVITTLNSKIVGNSTEMAKAAIFAMEACNYEKEKIRILKKTGGMDDVCFYNSMLFETDFNFEKKSVKVGVAQFCISAPKTNMDSKILVDRPDLMEKIIDDERKYILDICKKIKLSGCNLLILQKSILRDSLSDLGRHFLQKLGVLVIDKIDRKEIEIICENLQIEPISDVNLLGPSSLREVVIQNNSGFLEIVGHGSTIVLSGFDDTILEEVDRSLNDALCVVKCIKDEPFIVPGGGAVECGVANEILNMNGNVVINREISKGFEYIPYILARNAGLNEVQVVSELKKLIKQNSAYGVSVRGNGINNMVEDDNVVQPVSITKSTISLAIETVIYLLKIDDVLPSRGH